MEPDSLLKIIYEDDHLIAINKPHGLLVHRSKLANDVKIFALQLLRNQIGQKVYPAHRLDRKTSGVLLFTKSKEVNSSVQQLFQKRLVHKEYLAIVRGHLDDNGIIDYPLVHNEKSKEAQTKYTTLNRFEIPIPFGKFDTSRYCLLRVVPSTGRHHQIRKHLAHIFHPIIGDRPHGCNKQNKLWKESFRMTNMLLHAKALQIEYPDKNGIKIEAEVSRVFKESLELLQKQSLS